MATQLGPQRIGFPTLLLKTLAGFFGGAIGAVVLLFIMILTSSILNPFLSGEEVQFVSPIFTFLVVVMVFISSTIGNILSVLLLGLTEKDKYKRISSALYQIFIASIIIFILMVPIYFLAVAGGIGNVVFAIALHMILSVLVSALVLEILSYNKYALVGVYSIVFSIIASAAIIFAVYAAGETRSVMLFALPIMWGSFAFVYSIVNMIYGWIVDIYDQDFLALDSSYGDDYGKTVVEKVVHKAKDEVGSDFLKHN